MIEVVDGHLKIGERRADMLTQEFGSPLYVYDAETIRLRYNTLKKAISYDKLDIHFACKANTNLHIMRLLREEGCGIDAVSEGEVRAALKAGFTPEQIMFTGNNVTDAEMKFVKEQGVLINADSLSQLERYGMQYPGSEVSVRINPDVGAGHHDHCITGGPESKFGIYYDQVDEIKKIAKAYDLKIVGVHEHIGTGILETESFLLAMDVLLKTAKEFPDLKFVDFGGGIGIPYRPEEHGILLEKFGKAVADKFREFCAEYGRELRMLIEPGRYLVGEAGVLLATVNTVKRTDAHTFVGVDTGFNHLVRPTMYGSYHDIINATIAEGPTESVVIAGNICESGDVFTMGDNHKIEEREIPALDEGSIIAIMNTGAYGYSMAMFYNTRPRPAEILVNKGKARVIRKADTYEQIIGEL